MKLSTLRFLRFAFLILFALAMIRFFPLVVRFAEAAALSVREFWWGALVLALVVWALWVWRKRRL